MRNVRFVLSVDTEEEWDWDGPFPNKVISVDNVGHLPEFHKRIDAMGLRASYFLDYAVLENSRSRQVLKDLYGCYPDVEFGAHLHPWVTPPVVPVHAEADSHIVNLPIDVVSAQLTSLTMRLRELTDCRPTAFRSGRWGINDAILKVLAGQGYRVDSSIYPFYENDWFSCTRYDSWPLAMSYLKTEPALIELPVTAGFNHGPFDRAQRLHKHLEHPAWARFHVIGILWKLGLHRKIYLSPELSSAQDMIALCRQVLDQGGAVIHMYLHSSSLLPGSTRYVRSDRDKQRLMERIEQVVEFLRSQCQLQPETISAAAWQLRDEGVLKEHG